MTATIPSFETISLVVTDAVATLTLQRPEKRNAINLQMHTDLTAALKLISRSPDIRALLMTGSGPGFCAGQDLSEFSMARADPAFRIDEHVRATFNQTMVTIRSLKMPVIAAVNGVAAGAGCSLTLAADIRIAADTASFNQAFVRIGLIPDTGSTWLLPELIGAGRATHMALTGDPIDAATALDWGLVTEVVAAAKLAEHSTQFAQRLAALPTRAIDMTKRALQRATRVAFADALDYEAQLQQHAAQSHDHQEGVMAFLEKRPPVFIGS